MYILVASSPADFGRARTIAAVCSSTVRRQLTTIFCRSGQVTGTTAIAKNGQSSVLDQGAASPDQKSFVARSPAVTLAAAAHHLAVPFFHLSGTFSGKSKWEQISGKLPPIGIGKAAPLVLSRSTFPIGKA